ncbi:UPF0029-domain-containing protein [Schizopora paradoxa]|uniref:UPF0029-domain-containing protein n=1 Tax=Schizopora paradoxa TaxID=27342 RepID=A0A0H2RXG9_9AGAM|nr:UPF0029-domain-containing protein [Schizopora paradoxa]
MEKRKAEDPSSERNFAKEFEDLLQELSQDEDSEEIISEMNVLQSIYGDLSIGKWESGQHRKADGRVRYEVHTRYELDSVDTRIRVLVSLPPSYPKNGPPQLQLLSRYIGAFSVDSGLFGAILRTYISNGGVEWTSESVCVFDGIENVKERCFRWYSDRLSGEKVNEILREDEKHHEVTPPDMVHDDHDDMEDFESTFQDTKSPPAALGTSLPPGVEIYVAEPVIDRKSIFVGRACRINDPSEVKAILSHLMTDRRIARAAHPIINAWRCTVNGIVHQDNDDDGESAAGGRLAHLLQILAVDNVLVIVTRYFGGILLGADRFKHINQAARNSLEIGGFLDTVDDKKPGRTKKKR